MYNLYDQKGMKVKTSMPFAYPVSSRFFSSAESAEGSGFRVVRIWGIIPETTEGTKPVKLFKNYGIEKSIRIKPTRLQDISTLKSNK